MFFRFSSALFLVVAVSLLGIALEKEILAVRRGVTAQHFQMDALREAYVLARLETQQLGAPERLVDSMESGRLKMLHPAKPLKPAQGRMPLLHWQRAGLNSP